ncbi:MAG: hypothetical protein JWO59_2059 [Chloroflexi bacterium]|jgi:hypothetical protein|nr:hypothetical protein [Chloroflexota bacterium]MDB5077366.1 hypothetical protein [Chloroflexota bacterium]
MERQPVTSSSIRSIGYDPATSMLEIEFNNGHIYQYSGVPESQYRALLAASSRGAFFNTEIKDQYTTRKVG